MALSRKIGLFMGTFDPIHVGHVQIISGILNILDIDNVLVVPSMQNPWKEFKPASFADRCTMIKKAIAPFGDKCSLSPIEAFVEGTTWSYKTLSEIRKTYGDDHVYYIISGSDVLAQIPKWKNFETDIKPNFHYIGIARQDDVVDPPFTTELKDDIGELGEYTLLTLPRLDVSSTMVRDRTAMGDNPYPLVPAKVAKYIKKHNLYQYNHSEDGLRKI